MTSAVTVSKGVGVCVCVGGGGGGGSHLIHTFGSTQRTSFLIKLAFLSRRSVLFLDTHFFFLRTSWLTRYEWKVRLKVRVYQQPVVLWVEYLWGVAPALTSGLSRERATLSGCARGGGQRSLDELRRPVWLVWRVLGRDCVYLSFAAFSCLTAGWMVKYVARRHAWRTRIIRYPLTAQRAHAGGQGIPERGWKVPLRHGNNGGICKQKQTNKQTKTGVDKMAVNKAPNNWRPQTAVQYGQRYMPKVMRPREGHVNRLLRHFVRNVSEKKKLTQENRWPN